LATTAPDSFTRDLANRKDFWSDSTLYKPFEGLISNLFTCYGTDPGTRAKTYLFIINQNIFDLCVRYVPGSRKEYLGRVNALLLKTARTLDINKRSQRRVFTRLVKLLEFASDIITNYPKEEGLTGEQFQGLKLTGARRQLTAIQAAAITQLRRALRKI
jgi:hypothetical protein